MSNDYFNKPLNILRSAYIRLTKELHPTTRDSVLHVLGHSSESVNIYENLRKFAGERLWILLGEKYNYIQPELLAHIHDYFGDNGWKKGAPSYDDYIQEQQNGIRSPIKNLIRHKKAKDIQKSLKVSLKEIFYGAIKKASLDTYEPYSKFVSISVPKGCLAGTTFRIPQQSNAIFNDDQLPDIVFTLVDEPDGTFWRKGSDLYMIYDIDLEKCLCGFRMHIHTIDGREFHIMIEDVVNCTYVKIVPNEGLPYPNDNCRKGDLYIKFRIKFPNKLKSPDEVRMIGMAT